MSGKKVTFAAKRPSQAVPSNIDKWVENREPAPVPPPEPEEEPMKRLTIDVSLKLHTNIKSACAMKNLHMADDIRDLLERHYGGQGVGEGALS